MTKRFSALALSGLAALLVGGTALPARAQKTPVRIPAVRGGFRAVDMFGTVEVRAGNGAFKKLASGAAIPSMSTVRTGDGSAVLVALPGGGYLRVGGKSVVQLLQSPPSSPDVTFSCRILSGQAWAIVPPKSHAFVIETPSATARSSNGLFGVGYDLETDQSGVSVGVGSAEVALPSSSWKGTATTGQYVLNLRRPQPNIRLRAPIAVAQTPQQQTVWKLLRTENWTLPDLQPSVPPRMLRGMEPKLRVLLQTPQVVEGAP